MNNNRKQNQKTERVYIFGHTNPDTDSICSSIAYAHLKRELGLTGAEPYRLGDINQETDFVLTYFGVDAPPLLEDVSLKVSDIDLYEPDCISEAEPVKTVWDKIRSSGSPSGSRIVPITSSDGKVKGIVGMDDVTKIFMEISDEEIVKRHEILYKNLINILNGEEVRGKYNYDKLEGSLYIGTNFSEYTNINNKDVVITGKLDNAWRLAYDYDFGCIILTNGIRPKGLEGADCAIVQVQHSMFKTVSLVSQAISVSSLMSTVEEVVTFSGENYLENISDIVKTSRHRNFPVVNKEGVLIGILSRRHLMNCPGKKVILIDHNERSQSVEGLSQAEITEIIDHHRVADIQTDSPLFIRSEPVGATATIVCKMYRENNVEIPKNIAGVLLAAILSDTLMFGSPTCTIDDKDAAKLLAKVAGLDINEFGKQMFTAGTSLEGYTVDQILGQDRKCFNFGKSVTYISQINTLDFHSLTPKLEEILDKMKEFLKQSECNMVVLMITDIIAKGSEIIAVSTDKSLLKSAFNMPPDTNCVFLPGVVSRKKQIVPMLTNISTRQFL